MPPRHVLMIAMTVHLFGCHRGSSLAVRGSPCAADPECGPPYLCDPATRTCQLPARDGAAGGEMDAAPLPDATAALDTPTEQPSPAASEAGAEVPADATSTGDTSAPPAAACLPHPPAESCPPGRATCGGATCATSLTTDQNCGQCGRTCPGSFCQDADCAPAAIGIEGGGALAVAVTDGGVYWATRDGRILKRPLAGGALTVLSMNEGQVGVLAIDGTHLYFRNKECALCQGSGWLWRLALDGTERIRIAPSGEFSGGGLAIDARALYWYDGGTVYRLDKSAVPLTPQPIAIGQGDDTGIAIDHQFVYWGSKVGSEGLIKRAPLDGRGSIEKVAGGLQSPGGVAVDDRMAYWTDYQSRLIQMAPKEGGGLVTTLATPSQNPVLIAVDEDNVYWGLSGGNVDLFKVPRCGGEARRAAPALGIASIVTFMGQVYWSDPAQGVFRMAR